MRNTDSRPSPDPTSLTTEQLLREVASVVKLFEVQIACIKEDLSVRFTGIDREFLAIEAWRKEQKIDTKTAVDAALAAAEKAVRDQTINSEKSNLKTETAAAEQSRQQYATFTASLKGVNDILIDVKDRVGRIEPSIASMRSIEDAVSDLKDRVTKMESIKLGATELRSNARLDVGTVISLISVAVLLIYFFTQQGT